MESLKIILVDWEGFPLYRERQLGNHTISCGLGYILKNMHTYDAGMKFEVILIINTLAAADRETTFFYEHIASRYPFIKKLCFRDNNGQDLGAYNYGYDHLKSISYQDDVIFMNTTLQGPAQNDWLKKYHQLFHKTPDTGLCGISLNSHNTNLKENPFMPHVESFFLYSNMLILQKVFPENLCDVNLGQDKNRIISEGEIQLSQKILQAGYSIGCKTHDNFFFKQGDEWTIPSGDQGCKRIV